MIVLWIVLAIVAILALVLTFGKAKLRIVCRESLDVALTICGFPYIQLQTADPPPKAPKNLAQCRNPNAVLKRELKKQEKAAKKAERQFLKKKKKATKKKEQRVREAGAQRTPKPNLKENLDMITAILKKLYEETYGKLRLRVSRLHIKVGATDAAETAILYGVILQSVSHLLNLIETKFNHVEREDGEITLDPDYTSGYSTVDIHIEASMNICLFLKFVFAVIMTYDDEQIAAYRKAARRIKQKEQKRRAQAKQ